MPVTGTYETVENRPMVRFERTFPHPVDAVWEAVTDPSQLAQWFPSTMEFQSLEPGATIRFEFPDHDDIPVMTGEVLTVEPPSKLAFTWGDDELTFELEPQDGGAACRLRFTVLLDGAEKAARDAAGWEVCLDELERVAAGGAGKQPDTSPSGEWREYYEEYQRRGLPATAPLPE
jgi:uncharacterized protein YndB with AHSA1/START domain